jgi:hypothetical protein
LQQNQICQPIAKAIFGSIDFREEGDREPVASGYKLGVPQDVAAQSL